MRSGLYFMDTLDWLHKYFYLKTSIANKLNRTLNFCSNFYAFINKFLKSNVSKPNYTIRTQFCSLFLANQDQLNILSM